jgi:Copper type II ascorbate-dependent monooxygenase, N-terminal domain/Copper type II ascorbate-dependent monooxygenase, C-terminal domain
MNTNEPQRNQSRENHPVSRFRPSARVIVTLACAVVGLASLGVAAFQVVAPQPVLHSFDSSLTNSGMAGMDMNHAPHRINQNISDVAWSLTPPRSVDQTTSNTTTSILTLRPPEAYTPDTNNSDDYHCFLFDPKLNSDRFVTATGITPDQKTIVHHVILFKISGDAVADAERKNSASGGKGWTCFGGPGVGDGRATGGSWLSLWAPGAGVQNLPEGVGSLLPKDSRIVMQVHYNLSGGVKPDRTSAQLSFAPEGTKLTPMRTVLAVAPVELPCPAGANSPNCNRDTVIAENAQKYGPAGSLGPQALLARCKKNLDDLQKSIKDASSVLTSCDETVHDAAMLYAVAGHMHLRGRDIRLELNPGTPSAKTLLHIPSGDFHWQGNYWFKTPLTVKPGDVLRVSCTFDNSASAQPVVNNKPLEPRYVVWGESTTDEMCLGVLQATPKTD